MQIVQPMLPGGVFRILTSLIRGGNNILGGMSFVFLAKVFGVQKAAEEAVEGEVKKLA